MSNNLKDSIKELLVKVANNEYDEIMAVSALDRLFADFHQGDLFTDEYACPWLISVNDLSSVAFWRDCVLTHPADAIIEEVAAFVMSKSGFDWTEVLFPIMDELGYMEECDGDCSDPDEDEK